MEQETLLDMAEKLCWCRFTPGSRAKLFARDMRDILRKAFHLTERQEKYLRDLRHKYRRQIDGTRKGCLK